MYEEINIILYRAILACTEYLNIINVIILLLSMYTAISAYIVNSRRMRCRIMVVVLLSMCVQTFLYCLRPVLIMF